LEKDYKAYLNHILDSIILTEKYTEDISFKELKYLRALKNEFFEAFFRRIHDHRQSDALTQGVFQELGLPEVSG